MVETNDDKWENTQYVYNIAEKNTFSRLSAVSTYFSHSKALCNTMQNLGDVIYSLYFLVIVIIFLHPECWHCHAYSWNWRNPMQIHMGMRPPKTILNRLTREIDACTWVELIKIQSKINKTWFSGYQMHREYKAYDSILT